MTASRPRYFRSCHTTLTCDQNDKLNFQGFQAPARRPTNKSKTERRRCPYSFVQLNGSLGGCDVDVMLLNAFVEVNKIMLPQGRGEGGAAAGVWHLSWLVWTADSGSMYERGQCWNYSGIIGHTTLKVTIIIVPNCVATPAQQQYSPNEIVHFCVFLSCVGRHSTNVFL